MDGRMDGRKDGRKEDQHRCPRLRLIIVGAGGVEVVLMTRGLAMVRMWERPRPQLRTPIISDR